MVSRVNNTVDATGDYPDPHYWEGNSLNPAALHIGCQQLTALSPFVELPERLRWPHGGGAWEKHSQSVNSTGVQR